MLSTFLEVDMFKKYIPYILIFFGIIIIGIALYIELSTAYYQKEIVEEYYNNLTKQKTEEINDELLQSVESSQEDSVDLEDVVKAVEEENKVSPVEKYLDGKVISGIIEIPKLNVTAAILEGTDDRALKYTVGHYPGTANFGEKGNSVLLGHRNYVYGHYFRELDKLELGDLIILRKGNDEFIYEVTNFFVVEPTEMWVLDSSEEAEVTLITCTPIITYTHRLIIKGRLIE